MSARKHRGGFAAWLNRYLRARRGAISPLMAMGLVPLIGALAMGVEASNWWLVQRSAQNAADSAALAAAWNGANTAVQDCSGTTCTNTSSCPATGDECWEARDVAAKYAFSNAPSATPPVRVDVVSNVTCPSPLTEKTCFQVTVTKEVPIHLLSIVGFNGDTTISGTNYQTITATAVATSQGAGVVPPMCVLALGGGVGTTDITVDGGPNANMNGCAVGSNSDSTCNGSQKIGGAIASYAVNDPGNDCADPSSGQDVPWAGTSDPYSGVFNGNSSAAAQSDLASCGGNFTGSTTTAGFKKNSTTGDFVACGTMTLSAAATVATGGTYVIENGSLDLTPSNNANLTFTNPSTLVFSGTPGSTTPVGAPLLPHGGSATTTLTISAPTTGTFANIAIYQDPAMTAPTSLDMKGVTTAWVVNGLVYMPYLNLTIRGAIDKGGTGCIGFVVDTITIDGTADIIDTPGCSPITLPPGVEPALLTTVVSLVK